MGSVETLKSLIFNLFKKASSFLYVKIFPILNNKKLKEIYNNLAKNWGWAESSWGYEGMKKFINLVQKGKVLDLGCGSGFQSKYLTEAGMELVGVDFSEKMIEEAANNVPEASFLVMDMLDLDFPDDEFDGVYARASLLHLKKKDVGKIIEKINQILKRNGIFYVAVKEGKGEKYVDHPEKGARFFSFYKEKELKKLLVNGNFGIKEVFYEKFTNTNWLQILAIKY